MAQHEFSIWQQLDHPNIVRCFGKSKVTCFSEELNRWVDATAILMEYLGGGDLFDLLKFGGAFSEDQARLIFLQILDGVQHIHSKGISHLDLKLDNIFVASTDDLKGSDGLIKIGDFGLSAVTKCPNSDTINYKVGSDGFQAPEILVDHPNFVG